MEGSKIRNADYLEEKRIPQNASLQVCARTNNTNKHQKETKTTPAPPNHKD